MAKSTAYELASKWFTFETGSDGWFTHDQIQTACLLSIAGRLNSILNQIGSFGKDGIHDVLREMRAEQYRRKKRRRGKAKEAREVAKRKRAPYERT